MTDGPLIVQSDKTVLLEVDHELAGAARAAIAPFAELERAPEHIHTYRISPLSLWNAAAAGLSSTYFLFPHVASRVDRFLSPDIALVARRMAEADWGARVAATLPSVL